MYVSAYMETQVNVYLVKQIHTNIDHIAATDTDKLILRKNVNKVFIIRNLQKAA